MEFSVDRYYNLPYEYVLEAYDHALKQKQRKLHELESPIALLTSLTANINRDSKKQKKPYKMNDFFLFEPSEDRNIPTGTYGAAAMKLIEIDQFPSWALFVYKDLSASSNGAPPSLLAFIHEEAILLAPIVKGDLATGMLICTEKAYKKTLEMKSPCGEVISVDIPPLKGAYVAIEDIELELN